MTPMIYKFSVEVDFNEVLPTVGNLVDGINSSMADFGFTEKMSLRGKLFDIKIEHPAVLCDDDLRKTQEALQKAFDDEHPEWHAIVGEGVMFG